MRSNAMMYKYAGKRNILMIKNYKMILKEIWVSHWLGKLFFIPEKQGQIQKMHNNINISEFLKNIGNGCELCIREMSDGS